MLEISKVARAISILLYYEEMLYQNSNIIYLY